MIIFLFGNVMAQTPKSYSTADILQQMKKLEVFGSVLYIAAHPDDENTRLLAYLANERKFRTGYLSLTRGDGGQNLIGDEQGIDLGLIRTQELLAARRIDGAEQFFTRAYDFGFSKSPDETMKIWGHDKILSDVVWVIRNFRPDVVITRFPTTGEGGHGHHTASAILAGEAFEAAADPARFPEQLVNGITTWQVKRLLWNTFNFGGNNTTREDQLKIDVGMYNPILGKSYGEMASESRSQHKSQGFGVPAQRGESFEYFATIRGEKPVKDLMDGIDITSNRIPYPQFQQMAKTISREFNAEDPSRSVAGLVKLYTALTALKKDYWVDQKLSAVGKLVESVSGIFMEATSSTPYVVIGDTLKAVVTFNNRLGINITDAKVRLWTTSTQVTPDRANINNIQNLSEYIPVTSLPSQPYWLDKQMNHGSFNVTDQSLIGKAEIEKPVVNFIVTLEGERFTFEKPLRYKFTDPVKGEIYQPVVMVPALTVTVQPALTVVSPGQAGDNSYAKNIRLFTDGSRTDSGSEYYSQLKELKKGQTTIVRSQPDLGKKQDLVGLSNQLIDFPVKDNKGNGYFELKEINYDHIPAIRYFKPAVEKVLVADVKIAGKRVGYINGAGDKVPAALEQMGYSVSMLDQKDITPINLRQFDAIVTGVRAYNTNPWMSNAYDALMNFVKEGGVLLVQYNTNNGLGPLQSRMAPYPLTISRNRVTDETATVNFLLPDHPVLNYPNKITQKDFDGWIQERSIYNAEAVDNNYQRILSMKDPGEKEQDGSLVVADYGKGRFIYTGLVFFRELPAGVPGAYRLFANLIATPKPASKKETLKSK
jgi:LmbE family N-acetylglucosaminyl deacetylase